MRASLSLLAAIATSTVAQRVVPLSFSRQGPRQNTVTRRAATYSEELNNNLTGGGYYADVALGTPPQSVTLILDTGSSDVWVLDTDADLCQSRALQNYYGDCLATYDPSKSSTYSLVDQDGFSIKYVDSSGAEGDYIKDAFHIGGASIEALQVGLAKNSTINSGLLGIGFDTNVAADRPYRNIMDLFVDQGLIDSQAYSLYLDDLYAETGTILFGGLDTKKYIGDLKAIDIVPDAQTKTYSSFTVALSSFTITSENKSNSENYLLSAIPVVLDSGTTLTYLPLKIANQIYEAFNAFDDTENTGLVYVSCSLLSDQKGTTFDFQFGGDSGPLIRVPVDEMILDNVKGFIDLGLQLPDLPFEDACSFGIQSLSGYYLLGDTFLRSAYVVYDLSNKQIALAQANLNSTESNVVEITNSTGIPLVSGVASQASVTQTATGLPGTGGHSKTTNEATSAATTSAATSAATSTATSAPTVTVTSIPSGSASGNAAARAVPALNWEAVTVTLVTAFFSLAGASLLVR
ncbi:acid protease [Xylariaceae sp. FL1651]|nr:acid protease [Xylariaceae sp. FL1651]